MATQTQVAVAIAAVTSFAEVEVAQRSGLVHGPVRLKHVASARPVVPEETVQSCGMGHLLLASVEKKRRHAHTWWSYNAHIYADSKQGVRNIAAAIDWKMK